MSGVVLRLLAKVLASTISFAFFCLNISEGLRLRSSELPALSEEEMLPEGRGTVLPAKGVSRLGDEES